MKRIAKILSLSLLFFILPFLFIPTNSLAATITVCPNRCDSSTIQGGIDLAVDNDTVVVGDGVYHGNINFNDRAITVVSENGTANTTINGSGNGNVVTFNSGEGSGSVIEEF